MQQLLWALLVLSRTCCVESWQLRSPDRGVHLPSHATPLRSRPMQQAPALWLERSRTGKGGKGGKRGQNSENTEEGDEIAMPPGPAPADSKSTTTIPAAPEESESAFPPAAPHEIATPPVAAPTPGTTMPEKSEESAFPPAAPHEIATPPVAAPTQGTKMPEKSETITAPEEPESTTTFPAAPEGTISAVPAPASGDYYYYKYYSAPAPAPVIVIPPTSPPVEKEEEYMAPAPSRKGKGGKGRPNTLPPYPSILAPAPQPAAPEGLNPEAFVPAPLAPTSPRPASAPSAKEASTILVGKHKAGATELQVSDASGFEVGKMVELDDGVNSEIHVIVGFGSILLQTPLQHDYDDGTTIKQVSFSAPAPSLTAPSAAPVPLPDLAGSSTPILTPGASPLVPLGSGPAPIPLADWRPIQRPPAQFPAPAPSPKAPLADVAPAPSPKAPLGLGPAPAPAQAPSTKEASTSPAPALAPSENIPPGLTPVAAPAPAEPVPPRIEPPATPAIVPPRVLAPPGLSMLPSCNWTYDAEGIVRPADCHEIVGDAGVVTCTISPEPFPSDDTCLSPFDLKGCPRLLPLPTGYSMTSLAASRDDEAPHGTSHTISCAEGASAVDTNVAPDTWGQTWFQGAHSVVTVCNNGTWTHVDISRGSLQPVGLLCAGTQQIQLVGKLHIDLTWARNQFEATEAANITWLDSGAQARKAQLEAWLLESEHLYAEAMAGNLPSVEELQAAVDGLEANVIALRGQPFSEETCKTFEAQFHWTVDDQKGSNAKSPFSCNYAVHKTPLGTDGETSEATYDYRDGCYCTSDYIGLCPFRADHQPSYRDFGFDTLEQHEIQADSQAVAEGALCWYWSNALHPEWGYVTPES